MTNYDFPTVIHSWKVSKRQYLCIFVRKYAFLGVSWYFLLWRHWWRHQEISIFAYFHLPKVDCARKRKKIVLFISKWVNDAVIIVVYGVSWGSADPFWEMGWCELRFQDFWKIFRHKSSNMEGQWFPKDLEDRKISRFFDAP